MKTEDGKLSLSLRLGSEKTLNNIISGKNSELWVPASYDNMDKFTDEYALQGTGREIPDFVTNDGEHWGSRTLKDIGELRVYIVASSKKLWANVTVKAVSYEGRSNRWTGYEIRPFIVFKLGTVTEHN